jgi:hypothetical protein
MPVNLPFDGFNHFGVAMAKAAYGNAGNEIHVPFAIGSVDERPFGTFDLQSHRRIAGLGYVMIE